MAFVAAVDVDGAVRLASRDGEATLRCTAETITYTVETADPLGGGTFSGSGRAWLARSFDTEFPDAAVQLLDQFRSPRTGDLVVVANDGYDFRDRWEVPEHKAGHGSLHRAHMQVPAWSNQPLVEAPLRTVDLFATMLSWLQVPLPEGVDGELVAPVAVPGQNR